MTAWTRWFTGQTSVVPQSVELACMVGSQRPSSERVTAPSSSYFLLMALKT